jgi:lipopolysaccharide/colanic/teichoic acid biosynthesis glycosyltransferase
MRRLARLAQWAGIAGCVLGLSKAHAVAHSYDFTTSSRFSWSLVFTAALGLTAYCFGLPDGARRQRDAFVRATGAVAGALALVSVVQLMVGAALLPRAVVLGSAVVLVPYLVLCAALSGDARSRAQERDRVVLVGESEEALALRDELENAERPAMLVAELTADEATPQEPPIRPLVDAAIEARANVIVLTRSAQASEEVVAQAALLHQQGVRVRTLSLFYEQWLGKLPISELERVSLLFDIGEVHAPGYARFKRLLDVLMSAFGALALAAVLPFVLVGNFFGNRGSVFYRQPRVGRHGCEFTILKLRTMRAHDGVTDPTIEADPRVTPFGRVLRRLHVDELPQVLNVLRGELSIVGPRPEQPHLVDRLTGKIPFYGTRYLVRPGLTGWAQVKYHYGADDVDALEKLQYDVYYLRRQSFALDLRIVVRTLRHIVGLEGR